MITNVQPPSYGLHCILSNISQSLLHFIKSSPSQSALLSDLRTSACQQLPTKLYTDKVEHSQITLTHTYSKLDTVSSRKDQTDLDKALVRK